MEATATSSKSSSPASVIHRSTDPHLPHLGVPEALGGTRFFVPHCSQLTIFARVVAIRLLSDCVGVGFSGSHPPRRVERSIASMAGRSLPRPITLRARPNPAAAWIQRRSCRSSAARARAISRRTSGSTLGYCGSISVRALTRTAAVARRVNHL